MLKEEGSLCIWNQMGFRFAMNSFKTHTHNLDLKGITTSSFIICFMIARECCIEMAKIPKMKMDFQMFQNFEAS
jgi:hypothetical protein